MEDMRQTLQANEQVTVNVASKPADNTLLLKQRVKELEEELSQAIASSGEVESRLEEKEKELLATVSRLQEVDRLWSETQSALEREQGHNTLLQQEKGLAELSLEKVWCPSWLCVSVLTQDFALTYAESETAQGVDPQT